MNQSFDLDSFYAILNRLEALPAQGLKLRDYGGSRKLPARGVYFFREPTERRSSNANSHRIIRVGTHAVSSKSKSTLWQRLRAHLGTQAGGGNHRGSIFRLHVGAALLARDSVNISTWGVGSTAPPALRNDETAKFLESTWEKKVSEFIGEMTVLWVSVPDEPSSTSIRAVIEKNAIALLSNRFNPIDAPKPDWLGLHSPRDEIRRSGLWNLNYVDQGYEPAFLELLRSAVEHTVKQCLSDVA